MDDIEVITSLLTLTNEQEVNYAFAMTMRSILKQPNFMSDFIESLYSQLTHKVTKLGNMIEVTQPIPTVDPANINQKTFHEHISKSPFTPFIVKGFLKETPAYRQWTLDYLMDTCQQTPFCYTETNSEEKTSEFMFAPLDLILKQMFSNNENMIYIHNTSQLFKNHPQLLDELHLHSIKTLFKPIALPAIQHLFLGKAGSGLELHAANELNAFLMINGTKEWTLIDPRFSFALSPIMAESGRNAYLEQGAIQKPLYPYIPKYISTIESGDMLIFGPWWWHSVRNLSPTSIAVGTRWVTIKHNIIDRGSPLFQNIQLSNPTYKKYSLAFLSQLLDNQLIGDDFLQESYKLSYRKKDES